MSKSSFSLGRLSFIIALQLTLLFLGNKAQAGGGDSDPSDPVDPASKNPPKIINAADKFKWDKWSQPYWSNTNLCRDKGGEIICLNSDNARNSGWDIPARN
jgi:hypothetical protein